MPLFAPLCRRSRRVLARVVGVSLTTLSLTTLSLTTLYLTALALAAPRAASAQSASPLSLQATLDHTGGGTATMSVNASSNTTFTLTNVSGASLTINLTVTACSGSLVPGSCTRTPTSVTLADGAQTTISSSFSSGAAAGAGTLTLTAKNTAGTTLATSTVAVTVTATAHAPTVSDLPHVGDRIEPGLCVADCFETTFGYATPAYMSFDTPRSVALLYRSGRAKPYGRVSFDVTDATGTTTAFRLRLMDPAGTYVTFTNDSTSLYFTKASSGATRLVAEFDAGAIATSAKLYTAYVTSYDGSTQAGTTSDTLRVIIVNGKASVFGAGVDLVGFQRLYDNASQTGGVLITDGSGAASFFRGSCAPAVSCTYTSPGGDFSVLTTGSNQYKRTYPDGTVVTFDATGNELSAVSRFGAATSFAYSTNVSGQVVPWAIGDGTGNTIDLRYRGAPDPEGYRPGSLTTITAPTGGRRADFRVNAASGNLQQVLDFDNLSYGLLGYDTQHRLTSVQDKKGYTWNYRYAYGRPVIDTVDAPSVEISGPSGPSTVRPRTLFREAYSGLYSAAATGGGRSVTSPIPVPAFDIRAAVTDPRGNSTFFSLNRFGSPRKTYAPLTPSDSVEYNDVTGQVTRTISPTGHEMVYSYYPSGLLRTRADNALGKLDSLWYETKYALVQAIKGTDGEQWFWHDTQKAGWPLTKTAPTSGGPFTWYYKDARGRDSVIVDPSQHRVSYTYATSGLQNLVSVTAPNGQTTTYGRNAWGLITSVTAPNLAKSTDSLDVLNRRVWNAGQYGDTTRYTYNELDQLTVLKDAKGQVDSLKRNALGWVRSHVYANGAVDSTHFDAAGNAVDTWSRAGRHVHYVYDSLSRLVTRTGAATQIMDSLSYDPSGRWVTVRSRVGGTVLSTDTDSTNEALHISYSATVRPSGTWRLQRDFHSNDPGISSAILYKQVNGSDVTAAYTYYSYDTQHRLASIRSANDTTGFTYNGENLVDSRSLSGNLGEAFTYTSGHELATRAYTNASWVEAALHRWYRTDSLQRITERGGADSLFQAFTYDSAGRLRSWAKKAERSGTNCVNDGGYGYKCTGPTPWLFSQVSPTYDKVGNPHPSDTAVTATGNRLTSYKGVTMTYDADGFLTTRVIGATTDSLTWDEFGRLVSMKRVGGATTTFTYDGMGRRISKTSAGTTVQYLWDGDQMIAELDGSGTIQKSYTYDGLDHPRSVTTGGETYFFSTEPDGTVDGVIRRSDRNVGAQYAYTPWGELESTAQPFDGVSNLRWKGLPYDAETGLYYMRARYYDPKIRRFISEDPIGFNGGINVYAFASGDPVNKSDPSGLDECWLVPRVAVTAAGHPGDSNYMIYSQELYWVEQCKQMTSHTWSDVLGMFKDFVTGEGPTSREFGQDSPQVAELRNAPGVNAARKLACDKARAGQAPSVTDYGAKFGIGGPFQARTNATRQFVGSFNVEINPVFANGMQFVLTNTTSMTSFSYHILPSWERQLYVPHFGTVSLPFGNMYQTYTWTETTASCAQ